MAGALARDYCGTSFGEGARVEAWLDGVRYTATVKTVLPHNPGCEDHRHIVVVRDDDGGEHETFSDAVVVTGTPREGQT